MTFERLLFSKKPAVDVAYMRILLFGFFIYKLLSRNFSIFGTAPTAMLTMYPHRNYEWATGIANLAFQPIVDLGSFHWIHWFIPLPGEATLTVVYWAAIIACTCVVLLGRGPGHLFAISAYILLSYLWGFMWRSTNDVDAIYIPLQLALLYCFYRGPETLRLIRPTKMLEWNRDSGWYYSMAIIVFALYYFWAGINKILDLTPIEWFKYDLFELIGVMHDQQELGYFKQVAPWLHYLRNWHFLNWIGVPMAYLCELTVPTMFFKRRLIPYYATFFILFHFLTWGVGILFMGEMLMWFALVPIHRFIQPVTLVWNPDNIRQARWAALFEKLNWAKLIRLESTAAELKLEIRTEETLYPYTGLYALRRLCWVIPVLWPLLPMLYLFPLPFILNVWWNQTQTTSIASSHFVTPDIALN